MHADRLRLPRREEAVTNNQADADTLISDAHRIQNEKQCSFKDALFEACDGDVETISWLLLVVLGDVDTVPTQQQATPIE